MNIFQNYTHREQSLRINLSNRSWENGTENYFVHNVPWQYTSSHYLAQRIIELSFERIKSEDKIELLEIGAGSGLLTKNILDILQKFYPEIYQRSKATITDGSKLQIEQLKNSSVLKNHKTKIDFKVYNMNDDISKLKLNPTVIYFCNLIDSTSTYHINVKDEKINEVLVQTMLPKEIIKRINKDYQDLFKAPYNNELSLLIKNTLIESYKEISIKESSINPVEKEKICKYIKSKNIKQNYCFNFHPNFSNQLIKWHKKNLFGCKVHFYYKT